MAITGTAVGESIPGTNGPDDIDFSQGGDDFVNGFGGDDVMSGGAQFTALDRVNGGTGFDTLDIDGNYGAGVVFAAKTVTGVESIRFHGGNDYSLTTHDKTVAAGETLKIDAYFGTAGKTIVFDGSAETDGAFLGYDGLSNDTLIGGAQSDYLIFTYDGADTGIGNAGDDIFALGGALDATDRMDGGEGNDFLYLDGDYSTQLTINGSMFDSIDGVGLGNGFEYDLKIADSAIAATKNLFFDMRGLSGAGHAILNASAELDGFISTIDGINADIIFGSQQGDDIRLARGTNNQFFGLGGADQFLLAETLDATDTIDGGQGDDYVSLSGDYSAGLTLGDMTLQNVEAVIIYESGFDYRITAADGNLNTGETMRYSAGTAAGSRFIFDGSAEVGGRYELGGGAGNDVMIAGGGDDYIADQNGGIDKMLGGAGDDRLQFWEFFGAGDLANGGAGNDQLYISNDTSAGLTLGGNQIVNVEGITFGGDVDHHITALDSLVAANRTMSIDAYFLPANRHFVFDGSAETNGAYSILGGIGDDTLTGGARDDRLNGGQAGVDTLTGGNGNDTYVNPGLGAGADVIVELANGGAHDTIETATSFNLNSVANVEDLTLTGFGNVNGIGTGGDNIIVGSAGDNTLNGGGGNDTLDGSFGVDILNGGLGDDTYIDPDGDTIVEAPNGGIDTIRSYGNLSLAGYATIENLEFISDFGFDGTGNDLDNRITGTIGNNHLQGGIGDDTLVGKGGADTLEGGVGDDVYVDPTGATIVEAAGAAAGTHDRIESRISFSLASVANIEDLSIVGTAKANGIGNNANNRVVGNGNINILNGGGGSDVIIGLGGADTLQGGLGSDIYVNPTLGAGGDTIVEAAGAQAGLHDRVYSVTSFSLGTLANVEDLALTGNGNTNGVGNTLANSLTGNGGNNALNGGAGDDTLEGGAGTDTLIGSSGDDTYADFVLGVDTIVEAASAAGGIHDRIESAVGFNLANVANVEDLVLTGNDAIDGSGDGGANVITGNGAANTLNGGGGNDTLEGAGGADTLNGGSGDDTYVGFVVGVDTLSEAAGAAAGLHDSIASKVTFSLSDVSNVEDLTLVGTAKINALGNGGANILTGNLNRNVLLGGGGDDTLEGAGGNDVMDGGQGSDSFRFATSGTGADRIDNFETAADTFDLSGGLFTMRSENGGNTLLTHAGGTIFVTGVAGLSLDDWNALVTDPGARVASPAYEPAPQPADLPSYAHADWLG